MWLKRRTPQNIVIGGAAGAFPPVIGWAAVTGDVTLRAGDPLRHHLHVDAAAFLGAEPLGAWRLRARRVPMLPVTHGARETRRQVLVYTLAPGAADARALAGRLLGPGLCAPPPRCSARASCATRCARRARGAGRGRPQPDERRRRRGATFKYCSLLPTVRRCSAAAGRGPSWPRLSHDARGTRRLREAPARQRNWAIFADPARAGDRCSTSSPSAACCGPDRWTRTAAPASPATTAASRVGAFGVAGLMVGVSFAAVPLYDLFCRVTGYDGTPMIGQAAPGATGEQIDHHPLQRQYAAQPALALRARAALGAAARSARRASPSTRRATISRPAGDRHLHLQRHARGGRAATSTRPPASASRSRRSRPARRWTCRWPSGWTRASREDPNTRGIRTITVNYTFFRSLTTPSAPARWPMPGRMSARRWSAADLPQRREQIAGRLDRLPS